MFSVLPGNCWGGDSSRWGEMCPTDAADTLSSKLVIIHYIACVNIINIINIIPLLNIKSVMRCEEAQ